MEENNNISGLFSAQEVYRPPLERNSALLEVTSGCSYRKCNFCDFIKDPFIIYSLEEIERKIQVLAQVINGNEQLHFLGCNPFVLPTHKLMEILDLVHQYLPCVKEVTMYARAKDILTKSLEELRLLRQNGITQLHIGIESGSPQLLELHNKGETPEHFFKAAELLDRGKIHYHLSVILGLGGQLLSQEHTAKTAALLSRLFPISIWCMALKVWPGTPLADMVQTEKFMPMSPLEILYEERAMVEQLELQSPCMYVDSTVLNKYTLMATLPRQKTRLLKMITQLIDEENSLI